MCTPQVSVLGNSHYILSPNYKLSFLPSLLLTNEDVSSLELKDNLSRSAPDTHLSCLLRKLNPLSHFNDFYSLTLKYTDHSFTLKTKGNTSSTSSSPSYNSGVKCECLCIVLIHTLPPLSHPRSLLHTSISPTLHTKYALTQTTTDRFMLHFIDTPGSLSFLNGSAGKESA